MPTIMTNATYLIQPNGFPRFLRGVRRAPPFPASRAALAEARVRRGEEGTFAPTPRGLRPFLPPAPRRGSGLKSGVPSDINYGERPEQLSATRKHGEGLRANCYLR